ncbi:MAG: pyrroloquinoline quinone biosynthesis protein PqqE [Cellvibrionaceae bacterium]|nr:pyrroloquinoline quinone biosynthesis protein PqqE [Cellvibrionaceae bacterium]
MTGLQSGDTPHVSYNVSNAIDGPLWLLAELTYACPLHCPYCSNPLNFSEIKSDLSTEDWKNVFRQARELGVTQLGLSGGEPLLRKDLIELTAYARNLGFYTNLITSGIPLNNEKVIALKHAGLDHIQISFQSSSEEINNFIAGRHTFQKKIDMAKAVKNAGYPMVLCFVIHRHNIEQVDDMLNLAKQLNADYVELATVQYYGWAKANRNQLLPTKQQLESAENVVQQYRARQQDKMKIYYVVPDYYEERPKACMNGWGKVFLTVTPDGTALPCQVARELPGMQLPNVKSASIEDIWYNSADFNRFRGFDWMPEPCRSCEEKANDFGGCRCQAFLFTGDPTQADPVCTKSSNRWLVDQAIQDAHEQAQKKSGEVQPLIFRSSKNSKNYATTKHLLG